MQTISATDLFSGETVAIERNHTMVAKIVPPERAMTASQALAGLGLPVLRLKQGAAWLRDSKEDFDQTVRDPWA